MIYYLRNIFMISAVIIFLLMFLISIIGHTSEKLKSIVTNVVITLFVISCMFMLGAMITDIIYTNAIQSCIKSEYVDANNFSNKGSLSTFKSGTTYYSWNYNAKSNTLVIEGINLDFIKEIHNAI